MFDFHNHFTSINAFCYSDVLLPQNLKENYDLNDVSSSEIGLDKRFTEQIPLEKQIEELEKMLSFAKVQDKSVSIHCVQETFAMLSLLKRIKPNPYKIIWHGFAGSKETAKELMKLGVIISIGPGFHGNIVELYNANPLMVFETDYTGDSEEEHREILNTVYTKASCELNLSIMALEASCNELKLAFEN